MGTRSSKPFAQEPQDRHRGLRPLSLALIAVVVLAFALAGTGCTSSDNDSGDTEAVQSDSSSAEQVTQPQTPPPSGDTTPAPQARSVQIEDVVVGTGAEAVPGKTVTVHYTGWLSDGTKFDSSKDSGQPFSFVLGSGEVIQGWDQGVAGMKVGGVRKLTVPPDLGYGAGGYPPVIPGNATLVFEVELLAVN